MKNKVTIYTLAEELGMTPSMVSRALNPNGKVNEKKRKLVLKAAKKHNYMPNRFASRLSGKNIRIGILGRYKYNALSEQLKRGYEKAFDELKDYKIQLYMNFIAATDQLPKECSKKLDYYADYDGILISGFSSDKFSGILSDFYKKNPNLVQVQSVNRDIEYLFSSKHDEITASHMAAEFLYNCTKASDRKNILLFTGDKSSAVHKNAKKAFLSACADYGLNVLETVDMGDNEEKLEALLPEVFEKYGGITDGVYITSGVSIPLCRYIREHKLSLSLVTFDLFEELSEYIEDGTVSATIFQNNELQAKIAFEKLVHYILTGEKPEKDIMTDVLLVMKSNMKLYM